MGFSQDMQTLTPSAALETWRRLSDAETEVIKNGNLAELIQFQGQKDDLRAQMEPMDFSEVNPKWASALIAREQHNHYLLQGKMEELQLQLNEEGRSMGNIQKVHRAYGHQPINERQSKPIWHQVT
tara:strand:- start:185 stop:562 length:378 start_codon:yes stop_codon:yes gene_type:complete